MRTTYGRVAAEPGKHGPGDWRVTFNDVAPHHAEVVFMVGMLFVAEDRYVNGDQRDRLWWFIDRAKGSATNAEELRVLADQCQKSIDWPESFPRLRHAADPTDWLCAECRERVALKAGLCGGCWLGKYNQGLVT